MAEKSCATCRFSNKGQNEMPCVECSKRYQNNYTPMTNGDKIRQKTDLELSCILACPIGKDDHTCDNNQPCVTCILHWLREVANGEID